MFFLPCPPFSYAILKPPYQRKASKKRLEQQHIDVRSRPVTVHKNALVLQQEIDAAANFTLD